ncbi:CAP domain-containing protein [Streptomyces erythrochromogenes]|uniref:CAP domain-containing protein n=1 Tax=Streptomyces erythrochromogenes TaxID=285574 RepID=UPI0034315A67
MQKHRKNSHYRKISVTVMALGALGIPTAAMACLGTYGGPDSNRSPGRQQAVSQPAILSPDTTPPNSPSLGTTSRTNGTPGKPDRPAAADGTRQGSDTPAPRKPATTTPPAKAGTKPPAAPTDPKNGPTARVLALVNAERARAGCSAVTLNAQLSSAAQNHSKDMAAHRNMSHTGSDGSNPGVRIRQAGYQGSGLGENVAMGYPTAEKVMEGWMNSPGHRQNILNCAFKEMGIGLSQPDFYWTQTFGAAG